MIFRRLVHVTAIILTERQTEKKNEKKEKKNNYERKTNHEWFTVFVLYTTPSHILKLVLADGQGTIVVGVMQPQHNIRCKFLTFGINFINLNGV